uniref:glycoside hydrolase family 2 protein n=1 Tax=uncultured Draconibacterium sp. TaxID=1573823 RepID=UPI00321763C4
MYKNLVLILFLKFAFVFGGFAQSEEILLNTGWKAKRANELTVDGTVISSLEFELFDWMEAVIPGTVLNTMLQNNKVPDPFFGMNNELIPDIYTTGADYYTFWFHTTFSLPELKPGQQVWLKFRGINYSANIFLNGRRVNTDTHKGMFLREKYLITPFLTSETNKLAVIVEPPNPVGNANGGQGGDGTIARSVTQQFTAGWDWICPIRDRNTGIWDQVSVEITGPVDVRNSFVKPKVPEKRIPGDKQKTAFLIISTELVNASDEIQEGTLLAKIGDQQWTMPATIPAGETIKLTFPGIRFENPKLWWPNGLGEQNQYTLELSFEQNKVSSDKETVSFGIRETGSYFDDEVGGRVFLINGQKVFIKGGNWIASDALLRLSPERYEAEVRMHAEMNMNMIRVWGGAMPERPEFYDACDKYGLLVWQDLWVSGDCNGRWFDPRKKESQERRQAYPDDHSLFIETAIDQIKLLRNHPSLYLWCGGNEFPPPADIHKLLEEKVFPEYDGTRYYVNESTSDSILRNTIGGNGDGPYGIQNPLRFFTTQSYPFNPEIGSVGLPNVETMRKIMDEKDLTPPRNDRANPVWRYHKYIGYGDYIERLGEIDGIDDFCKKAQLINYEQYRALQEGFNAGMWNNYTGMLVWKNQNPWTALRGQFYDVFLDQTGGFYGYKQGAKALHVQLNLNDSTICVQNQTFSDAENLLVEAQLIGLNGNVIGQKQFEIRVEANTWKIAGRIFETEKLQGFCFLRLKLKNTKREIIDENLYWLVSEDSDWKELQKLSPVKLHVDLRKSEGEKWKAVVSNKTNSTAFFSRLKITDSATGDLVAPVFLDDNYITLFPGEQKQIAVDLTYLPKQVNTNNLILKLTPWNGEQIEKEF